ncbi:MAG: DegT/DnrJ/EryC1/StrS family aminotransferase [Pseudomonadota bacterium]
MTEITSVPLLDLAAQYHPIKQEIGAAIEEVLDSQRFVMGPKVVGLEEAVAKYSHASKGVGVSSGSDALIVALMALDVGPGDEVITTPYTFFATGGAIARLGAIPRFCDIDAESYNLSPNAVKAWLESHADCRSGGVVNRKTGGQIKAVMPVHLYGQIADMAQFEAIGKDYGLAIVEDAAQAIGSEDAAGKRAGSFGDVGCFSFFPSKNLGAFGDGGMCVTNDDALGEKMSILRLHGGKPKYHHAIIGGNFRLDAIQAAILQVKLKYLDDWTAGRQANAAFYDAALADVTGLTLPARSSGYRHIFNQYIVRTEKRDELRQALADAKVGNEIYYPIPLHIQKCFEYLDHQEGDFPESERAAKETLAIPIYPELSEPQKRYVVDTIKKILG